MASSSKKTLRIAGEGSNAGEKPSIKFARRTSSGRYVSLSKEDIEMSSELSADYMNYTVHIPPTPDNQPMDTSVAMKAEEQYVSNSLFTGGFNSEPYKMGDYDDDNNDSSHRALPLPGPNNMSVMKRNQNGEFDHNKWLFETKGTYGVGNAYWPPDDEDDGDGMHEGVFDASDKPWKPLCRVIPIPSGIISPYRLLIAVRLVVMCFFLHWRVFHPNTDAVWLWLMSITCEIWFGFSWILDQIPKLCPVNRSTDLVVLHEKFDSPSPSNPTGRSDLPGVDLFVSTADPEKEPPLTTANTILSILAVDYPVEKLSCYVSDDGGALLTFEAMAEAASFADLWVPFCRKHNIEPRNPESYFALKVDPTKNKSNLDFVKDRRRVKREYDEFKVRINSLPDSIRRRSDAFNAREEMKMMKHYKESGADPSEPIRVLKATWMADGTHWPGTWITASSEHAKGDHAGILQVMLKPPSPDPLMGGRDDKIIDFSEVDTRLPMFVYVSREKRPGYDHNKKAGAMNALVRSSAILSNGPFILNLDCDHYIYNCKAIREGMCFMMDRGGEDICYIQFPQRFEGIDPSDRYANHNTVFFDGNMRALDGLQGPFYVGTGCMFRRFALYGFDPPSGDLEMENAKKNGGDGDGELSERTPALTPSQFDKDLDIHLLPKRFGNSTMLAQSIAIAEYQGRPLGDHPAVKYGRKPGALREPRQPLDASTVAEAVSVISCWYEDKTEWGDRVGWIYGSVTEDVVTGYRMHNRGWRSVYCVTKRDAFRGSAPINLTDRLHQVLRWATGSVEIFFSKNNAFLGSKRLLLLQRLSYLNVGIYPFTSLFLIVYCFLPALSLFSGYFIVQTLSISFLIYLLTMTVCLVALAILEVKWSGVELEQWWRNEQFWLISGTSAHLAAVVQGLLKVIAGIEISFTLTSKSAGEDNDDIFADLYIVKWSSLMIPPIVIAMVNIIAIIVAFSRTIYSANPQWSKFIGGAFFSFWVLAHLYPFAKGLMGRRGKTPTIVYVWSGLIAITLSLLWVAISPPRGADAGGGGDFQFP
ncbi:cellulose synthase-like protein D4 [Trifolium pratense]|uniref:cellulose synthase-like protein D4 n=1 Tax=Trifolium pratense TaxID=57577 RepID=UPI001E6923C2|nr:cellulose synthase-like protein D4 [Trifolium pratense]